jgi:hypothetical protein
MLLCLAALGIVVYRQSRLLKQQSHALQDFLAHNAASRAEKIDVLSGTVSMHEDPFSPPPAGSTRTSLQSISSQAKDPIKRVHKPSKISIVPRLSAGETSCDTSIR